MNYEFTIKGNPSEELRRIKSAAAKKSVVFVGDSKEGTFIGGSTGLALSLKGIYGISGDKMLVTIIDKPATSSWTQVKTMLKNFIER